MNRDEILHTTESILNKAGFQISMRCAARRSCFDLVARRGEQLAFVKGFVNIGNISSEEALEIQMISKCFSATPLFIGDKTNKKHLDDDTVYMRYKVHTLTPKTLGNTIFLKMFPLVKAGPGGCYVNLNEKIIKKRRQELGLSVGKLAELMGVSRGTIYSYERGVARASVEAAYKLEWILGVQVAHDINVFQTPTKSNRSLTTTMSKIIRNSRLQVVLTKLADLFTVTPIKKAPFDFIAQLPEEQINIIGGVAEEKEPNIDQRTEEIISVSEVIRAQPVFIADHKQFTNNIPLIRPEEMRKIKTTEDLIAHL